MDRADGKAIGGDIRRLSRRIALASAVLCLAGIWLLARPYGGIRHDGILYVGQALLHLHPDLYSHDVFFAHGSQDSFSAFAPLYAWLIAQIGLPTAALLLMLLGQSAFLLGLTLLARQFLRGRELWFGLVFVAIMPGFYGGLRFFSYAETFVTARTFAEPLCLWGLYCCCRQRRFRGGLLLALGALMHPLIALPAWALVWMEAAKARPRAWWTALGLLALPLLAVLKVPPFELLLQNFDPDWAKAVYDKNADLFVRNWNLEDWAVLSYDLWVLLLARRYASGALKSAAESLLTIGIGAVLLSALFADLLGNVLMTGLQLWRAHWLVHLAGLLLTPWIYLRLWQSDLRPNAAVVIALLYLALIGSHYPGGAMALVLAAALIWRGDRVALSRWVRWFVIAFVLIAIASVTFKDLKANSYLAGNTDTWPDLFDLVLQGLTRPACLTLIALAFSYSSQIRRRLPAALLSALILTLGAYGYDQRSAWARFVENGLSYRHPFAEKLPANAQVYWQGDIYGLLGTWLLLQHPSYLTTPQAGGLVFDRETALHYRARQEAFVPLGFQESVCAMMNSLDQPCAVDVDALREVCALSDAPDFMIIESRIPEFIEAEWTFETKQLKGNTFYLYRCDRIRSLDSR